VKLKVKITRDSHFLTVTDFPYLFGIFAFPAAAFLAYHAVLAVHQAQPTRDVVGATFGALFFFAAGALFTQRSHFEFDRAARQLHWSRRDLFTRAAGTVPFDQIRHAVVQSLHSSGTSITTRVALVLADNTVLPFTRAYSTGAAAERARTAINDFLAVPATTPDDDILQLVLAGNKVDAIRFARTHYGYDLTQAKAFIDSLTPNDP